MRLGNLIAKGEGDYNSFNRGVAGDSINEKVDLTEMTIQEIRKLQLLPPGDPERLFAVGKYQVIRGTMNEVFDKVITDYDQTKYFTPEAQEEIFLGIVSLPWRSPMKDYITGKSDDLYAATLSAGYEWASIEDVRKKGDMLSVHEGTGGNKAHISVDEIQAALNVERALYQEHIQNGLPPEAAFAALNLRSSPQALVAQFDMQIEHKYTQIDKLNEQFELETDTEQRQQIEASIDSKHLEIAQLELDKVELIDEKLAELTTKKENLLNQLEEQGAQLEVLDRIETTLNNTELDTTNLYSQIKPDLDSANISLLSPHKTALSDKTSLDLSNANDVRVLQRVLIEEGLLNATATGNFATKTQQALRDALDKLADHEFDTSVPLDKSILDQLVKPPESFTQAEIQASVDAQTSALTTTQARTEKQIARIDETLTDLASQRSSVIEQKINAEQAKMNDLHDDIHHYDQTHIEPFTSIQHTLQAYQDNPLSDISAYELVKEDLVSQHIAVLSPRQQDFYGHPRFNNHQELEVQFIQKFLQERDLLPDGEVIGQWSEATEEAVKVYQRSQDLADDGDPGKNTKAAMKEDALKNLSSNVISQKVATAKQIALERKPLDIEAMNTQIDTSQITINKLNTQQQQLLSDQIQLRTQEKIELNQQISPYDQKLDILHRAKIHLASDQLKPNSSAYTQIQPHVDQANISLHTNTESEIEKQASLSLNDSDSIKKIQTLMHEQGQLSRFHIQGHLGPKTTEYLVKTLGVKASTVTKEMTLDQTQLTTLANHRLESLTPEQLQTTLQAKQTAIQQSTDPLRSQMDTIDNSLTELQTKQTQKQVENTLKDTQTDQTLGSTYKLTQFIPSESLATPMNQSTELPIKVHHGIADTPSFLDNAGINATNQTENTTTIEADGMNIYLQVVEEELQRKHTLQQQHQIQPHDISIENHSANNTNQSEPFGDTLSVGKRPEAIALNDFNDIVTDELYEEQFTKDAEQASNNIEVSGVRKDNGFDIGQINRTRSNLILSSMSSKLII